MHKFRLILTDIFDLEPDTEPVSKFINKAVYVLIIVSTFVVILETIPYFKQRYFSILHTFELFVTAVFMVELMARFLVVDLLIAQHTSRWERTLLLFYFFLDLLAVLPPLLFALLDMGQHDFFLTFRLLRVFKAFRHDRSIELVLLAVINKRNELIKSAILVFICTVFLSVLMYEVENSFEFDVPETKSPFTDIFITFAWSCSVFVNDAIGYQEMGLIPVTPGGRVIAGLIGFLNIAILIIPTGIVASGFLEVIEDSKIKEQYELLKASFRKKHNDVLGIDIYERPRTLFTIRNALFIYENHLYKMLESKDGFRIRAVQSATDEKYNDTNLVEHFAYSDLQYYGARIKHDNKTPYLIVVPDSFAFKGIGYFSYCLSELLGADFVSNEKFQKHSLNPEFDTCFRFNNYYYQDIPVDKKSKEYKKLPTSLKALMIFKKDIKELSEGKPIFVLNPGNFPQSDPYTIEKVVPSEQNSDLKKWLLSLNVKVFHVRVSSELLDGYSYFSVIKQLAEEIKANY